MPYWPAGLNLRPIMPVEETKVQVILNRKAAGKRLLFNVGLCFECGACVGVCPHDSLVLAPHGIKIDHSICTSCNAKRLVQYKRMMLTKMEILAYTGTAFKDNTERYACTQY